MPRKFWPPSPKVQKWLAISGLLIILFLLISRKSVRASNKTRAENPNKRFTVEEFTVTNTGLPNVPGQYARANIQKAIKLFFEPLQKYVGRELIINSGFRTIAVNEEVGGVPTSKHLDATATDFKVIGKSGSWLLQKVKDSGLYKWVDYSKVHDTYLHIEFAWNQ